MNKLKILIVSQYFWPENFKTNDLANHFCNQGHNVSVLTSIPNYPSGRYFKGYGIFRKRYEEINNMKIYRSYVIPRGKGSRFILLLNYLSFMIFASIKIIPLIRYNFDVVIISALSPITVAIPAIIYKKIKKTPTCIWVQDLWPESVTATVDMPKIINTSIQYILNPLVKFIYRECDKILVTSKGFIDSITNKSVDLKKIIYFPQWAENIFKPIKLKNYLLDEIPEDSFKVMFAGNIGEAQDFASILEAAKQLKSKTKIQWVVLGDGRKAEWVRNKINEYGLRDCFHLLGRYPLEKMPEFYSNADAMLVSLKDEYIFSITVPAKLQSYLACGKPILAMINGEGAAIINEANAGLTCNSGDSLSLSKNILKMSEMPKVQLDQFCNNSYKYSKQNFSRESLFKKADNILIDLA